MSSKNRIYLDFRICNFEDISHNEITEMIGINPVKMHIKGERINPNFSRIAKRNIWIMASPFDEYVSFEEKLNAMLDIIELKKDVFKRLSSKYYCELICTLYIYTDNEESTPSVHLDSRYNSVMKDFNIEFDVDIILVSDTKSVKD